MVLSHGAETHTRLILKAVSWRTLGTRDTFAISWFFTGKVAIASSIAGMEIITKLRGITFTNAYGRPFPGDGAERTSCIVPTKAVSDRSTKKLPQV